MSSTVSISVRSLLLSAALIVAVVIAYLLGTAARGPSAQAVTPPADSGQPARTITMTGTGEVTGVPDEMSFKLSVGGTAGDVSTALDQASGRMRQAVAALRQQGVEKGDTETTGLSIHPNYRYDANRPPVLTGYSVRQSMQVHVRSLRGAGQALSAVVAAGGNSARVSQLRLAIGDVDSLLTQARDKAVEEATAKAEQYAEATGQDLGEVVTLKELPATPPEQQFSNFRGVMQSAAADAAVPIRTGSQTLDVEVSVVWSLG